MNNVEQKALSNIDTDKLIELTQRLIRIPSVNPPGEYKEIAGFLHGQMRTMGLDTTILEGEPGRPNVLGEANHLNITGAFKGRKPEFEGSLSAGDLYHVLKKGIPGAWIGAGNGSLRHAVNERIAIEDLIEMARVYVLLVLRFCL